MPEREGPKPTIAEVSVKAPLLDAFRRRAPPGLSFENEVWDFAAQYIDYASAMFAQHREVRKASPTRDLIVAALLRRALIVAEAIVAMLLRGLVEAAVPLVRTLIDIELNARLVVQNQSESMAKRLAAYHYFAVKRHQEGILTDPATRDMLAMFDGTREQTIESARQNKTWFESAAFADVRSEIVAGRPWHGYSSPEDAFRAVGLSEDYYQTYDGSTLFVHAANVDFDFESIVDGQVILKAPLTADEMALVPVLGVALGHLHQVLTVFMTDKQVEDGGGELRVGQDRPEALTRLEAMGFLLAQKIPTMREMATRRRSRSG